MHVCSVSPLDLRRVVALLCLLHLGFKLHGGLLWFLGSHLLRHTSSCQRLTGPPRRLDVTFLQSRSCRDQLTASHVPPASAGVGGYLDGHVLDVLRCFILMSIPRKDRGTVPLVGRLWPRSA